MYSMQQIGLAKIVIKNCLRVNPKVVYDYLQSFFSRCLFGQQHYNDIEMATSHRNSHFLEST